MATYNYDPKAPVYAAPTSNTATPNCWVTARDIMFFKFRASLASQNVTWLAFGYSSIGDDV